MGTEYLEPVEVNPTRFADFWDELSLWSAPFGIALLDRVPIGPALTIVDVAAGAGFTTIELAQRCGSSSRVVAVDPWLEGLDRLRRKVDFLGLRNVEFVRSDIVGADLAAATADLVVCNLGVNNFANPLAVFAEWRRILRPGGTAALSTNFSGHMVEFYDVFRSVLIDAAHHDALPGLDAHIAHRSTFEDLQALLNAAGLEVVDRHSSSVKHRFADGSAFLRHQFIRVAFLQEWTDLVPEANRQSIFAETESRLNQIAHQRGVFEVTVPIDYVAAARH